MLDGIVISAQRKRREDFWAEHEDTLLRELWSKLDLTTHVIGKQFDPPRTKNAVIGRAKRLKLPPRRQQAGAWGNTRLPAQRNPHKINGLTRRKLFIDPIQPTLDFLTEPQNYTPVRVPLLDTRPHHCRAIIESSFVSVDGRAICCGHKVVAGQPFKFCDHHLALYTMQRRR